MSGEVVQLEETTSAWSSSSQLRVDTFAVGLLVMTWFILYLPTYWDLAHGLWTREEQSYGPIFLATAAWLLHRERAALLALPSRPVVKPAVVLAAFSMALYAIGRSQDILSFEVGSQIPMLAALLLTAKGLGAIRLACVPILLLVFMIPLPADIVAAATAPLKGAVSAIAAELLYLGGYPVARTGVILSVGPYQFLVADACAGLTSIFTLEAIGVVYLKLKGHASAFRNGLLATLLVPVALTANVVRVVLLVLITLQFGDDAGQGFLHNVAGIMLFATATFLMIGLDGLLGLLGLLQRRRNSPAESHQR